MHQHDAARRKAVRDEPVQGQGAAGRNVRRRDGGRDRPDTALARSTGAGPGRGGRAPLGTGSSRSSSSGSSTRSQRWYTKSPGKQSSTSRAALTMWVTPAARTEQGPASHAGQHPPPWRLAQDTIEGRAGGYPWGRVKSFGGSCTKWPNRLKMGATIAS